MRSIKIKVILIVSLMVSIPIIGIFGYCFYSILNNTLDAQTTAIRREVLQLDNAITLFINDVVYNVNMLSAEPLLVNIDNTATTFMHRMEKSKVSIRSDDVLGQKISTIFKQVQSSHPYYEEVYFGSEYGAFLSNAESEIPAGYDPRKRPWYQEALATPDKTVVSKTYRSTTGMAVVSVAKATIRQGRSVGVVSIDLSLKILTDIIQRTKIGRTGYVVAVQGNGVIISDPSDVEHNFKSIDDLNIPAMTDIFKRNGEVSLVQMKGIPYLALCHTSPGVGWKFLTFIEYDEIISQVSLLMWKSAAALAVVLVTIGLGLAAYLNKEIFKPLRQMITHLGHIGSSHYDARLLVQRRDEIGQVFEALNHTSAVLESNISEITSKGEEAQLRAQQAEEAQKKAQHAMELAETAKVQGMLLAADQLRDIVNGISSALEKLSTQIDTSNQRAADQSNRVTEVAVSIEQMTSSILEIARNAEDTTHLSETAKGVAKNGSEQIAQVNKSVLDIDKGFKNVYAYVSELSHNADGIGCIAQTIADIADQTNLLALNAAIEAARAGEAGRGFAVVADEVRKLAEKTMMATKEVGDAVGGIRRGVNATLDGMTHTTEDIAKSLSQTEEATKGLRNILDHFAESSSQIHAIATATEEQSSATEEINRTIGDINALSCDTAQAMQIASKAIVDLTKQAAVVREIISSLESGSVDGNPSS
ncbi:MAG: methyl-accepting chemotaxis protein [Solidesulfovibrio sp.]|uniref:methyl-accepting chemotaxis protein n=1 Tax=Solidesulfovibrio sp. TaxID=2910990 RepID=UPI002B1FB045|nr:methyl-accepting chemotaxis protein [Solidesulfovibrio sp.]MEA4854933.1 methyl-accepting chemotaxis protein [Solidesulfovibrio sp.]